MNLPLSHTSLELSRKLKELGLEQKVIPGDCYWVEIRSGWKLFLQSDDEDNVSTVPYPWCKAFGVAELGEMLPIRTASYRQRDRWWEMRMDTPTYETKQFMHDLHAYTEVDARGLLLCYLLEHNLITVTEINRRVG